MESELVRASVDQLKEALLDFPQVKVTSEQLEATLQGQFRADALLSLEVKGKPYTLVVEAKALSTPARLRAFLGESRWQNLVRRPNTYGIVAGPFFSDDSVKLCQCHSAPHVYPLSAPIVYPLGVPTCLGLG